MAAAGGAGVDPACGIDDPALLAALLRGFPVRLIASPLPLATVAADAALGVVLDDPGLAGFDHLPVVRDGRIVGLLERTEAVADEAAGPARLVGEAMRPLDERRLIAADAGILDFMALAAAGPCRLVLEGGRIGGLVTLSDLQKLPARAVLFTLMMRLELAMLGWIRAQVPAETDWLAALSAPRRAAVEERHGRLLAANQAIDRLSATMLADKRDVIVTRAALPCAKKRAQAEFERIEALRDALAHGGPLLPGQELLATVALTRLWIERLPGLAARARPRRRR